MTLPLILVAEDDPQDLKLTLRALDKLDVACRVETVADGVEALAFLTQCSAPSGNGVHTLPALMLLDIKMPKLSGIEVLRRLRAVPLLRRVPVVVLTSSDEPADIRRCVEAGANSYVQKPLGGDDYVRTVIDVARYWLMRNVVAYGDA